MFAVLFEVRPVATQWDAYLGHAKALRPELERIDGFIDNIRYRSLTRPGWLLSLSTWRDEKALVRWRTHALHHAVQEQGRNAVFADYHLRVGEVAHDTRPPPGASLAAQRMDQTQAGEAAAVTLVDGRLEDTDAKVAAERLGLVAGAPGLAGWDVFDAVLTPGDRILFAGWRSASDAAAFERALNVSAVGRLRRVRVVRDYGMFDRREAPQYFPEAPDRRGPREEQAP